MSDRRYAQLAQLPVERIHGIGPNKVASLAAVGINSVLDLLTHYPRRYLDRSTVARLADMSEGQEATVVATVRAVEAFSGRSRRSPTRITVSDGSRSVACVFFNQPWRAKQLSLGLEVAVFGKLERYRGKLQMTNPAVDLIGDQTGRIVPIYPQSDKAGLTSRELGRWIHQAVERAGPFEDPLPKTLRNRLDLPDRTDAIRWIHAPQSFMEKDSARRRLAFDELLRLQMILVLNKKAAEQSSRGIAHQVEETARSFLDSLPFDATRAQRRAVAEITADLAGPHPMHRLLQGDVGAGKTVVALAALLGAVEGGYQGALMAPTEVLAEQHFFGIRHLVAGRSVPDPATLSGQRPLTVDLLANRRTAKERRQLLADLEGGRIDILIGTHALLSDPVTFAALGVVVIDEQHRFGVEQRAVLRAKGESDPDVLVMTATPIPRTAAMTVFGDLDVTILDELPPGRTPVATQWCRNEADMALAWERIRTEVDEGRQAYVVCPLVDESEKIQARSATAEFERLGAEELSGLRLGLLHGQMSSGDKEEAMDLFRSGQIDVLVATTVVEVGVDVVNATVMVIEDADRFGMAQLHQLRGRVGRGDAASWCFLMGDASTDEGKARLVAMEATSDGFELAEKDLELRGEGTILGARQKGRNDLKLASLRSDRDLVVLARQVAFELVEADPDLAHLQVLADEIKDVIDPEEGAFLFKS
ncbi:MAG: ATP-dependent DNA helicase RecG [Acidimicrobiales bacterium]